MRKKSKQIGPCFIARWYNTVRSCRSIQRSTAILSQVETRETLRSRACGTVIAEKTCGKEQADRLDAYVQIA